MLLTLTRESADGQSVRSVLAPLDYPALENADCLIPAGTYRVILTFSPRFKQLLPLLVGVPGRSAIRIHLGSRPEHSRGCILLTGADRSAHLQHIVRLIQREEVEIKIL